MKYDLIARRAPAPVGAPYAHVLIPADGPDADALAKLPLGEDIAVKIVRGRSLQQHRLFWAVLTQVAEASQWETPERLLVALKVRLGRYDLMQFPSGKTVPVPHSTSFGAMDQDEFQRFMDDALRLISEEVVPGYSPEQLIADAQRATGQSSASAEPRPGEVAHDQPRTRPTPRQGRPHSPAGASSPSPERKEDTTSGAVGPSAPAGEPRN